MWDLNYVHCLLLQVAIASDHGLPQLLHLLHISRVTQLWELVTGILWNLSSCEVSCETSITY